MTPLAVPAEILRLDLWVIAAVTALMLWLSVTGWRVSRAEGGVLIGLPAAHIATLALTA